jgi:hypothetical protein
MHSTRPADVRICLVGTRPLLAFVALAGLLIAGCGAAPSASASTSSTSEPTAVPATPSTSCASGSGNTPNTTPRHQIGDLIVTEAQLSLAYPAQQLPDGTPLAPLKLNSNVDLANEFPNSPPVNPQLKENPSGYAFLVCNAAPSQPHVIRSVSVRIASFTPYGGQLNSWQFCDGTFARPQGASSGGCGGGASYEEYLHATFPTDAGAGATVAAAQTGTGTNPAPGATQANPLPVMLGLGKTLTFDVGITAPAAPGLYGFAFGLAIDDQSPTFFSTTQPALLAPIAHKWTGQACEAPAMQAKIPQTVTDPPTMYICPES